MALFKVCCAPGCARSIPKDGPPRCPPHQKIWASKRAAELSPKVESQPGRHLYHTPRWKRERRQFLNENPYCVVCDERGYLIEATVIDHIQPHRGDPKLFWLQSNWQPLCKLHHGQKTVSESPNFGGKRRDK